MGLSRIDRIFAVTLGVSILGHVLVVGMSLSLFGWTGLFSASRPFRLVYEQEQPREESHWSQEEIPRVQDSLKELPGPSGSPLQGSGMDGHQLEGVFLEAMQSQLADLLQITIGGSRKAAATNLSDNSGAWASAADLTNVTAAAQGNPVLLSYFGAIREQIQETANAGRWLSRPVSDSGVVYVGFVVTRTGAIRAVSVVPERSISSLVLQEVAVRIIQSSSPFLPFPPSFKESSKAIVVPVEFSVGPTSPES